MSDVKKNILIRVLSAVVALHVAAALKHHFVDRDGLLLRIMPARRRVGIAGRAARP